MAARATTKKRTTKKRTTKKRTTKKASTRSTKKAPARKPAAPRIPAAEKPRTKSEIFTLISEHAGISKKEVAAVFEAMTAIIGKDLKNKSVGSFNVPGLMKVTVQRKPAVPRRKGVNPFTKEEQWFKAKPARNVVKVRPLKGLKDLV